VRHSLSPWFFLLPGSAALDDSGLLILSSGDRIALVMWLKRLFGKGEKASPSAEAPSTKGTEQGREDRQKEFMNEQVRQRDEDESHMQDKPP
jgi:hypothetical protein